MKLLTEIITLMTKHFAFSQVFTAAGDLVNVEDAQNIVDKTVDKYGGIDILVCIWLTSLFYKQTSCFVIAFVSSAPFVTYHNVSR